MFYSSVVPLPQRFADSGRAGAPAILGALGALAAAVVMFTRFSIDGTLERDPAIYAYSAQQFAHGVPIYASIFDPKGPLASLTAGVAVAAGRLVGLFDLHSIRLAYLAMTCLTVLAVYWLALRLWRSVVAAVVAAVVFAAFRGIALDAMTGPDAKTPGILCAVLAMTLAVQRRWFAAALLGGVAFLDWQPLVAYPLVIVIVAVCSAEAGKRWRTLGTTLAGAALPLVVIAGYFVATGAFGRFFESVFVFPATGVQRGPTSFAGNVTQILRVVRDYYDFSGILFWAGLAALLLLVIVAGILDRRSLRNPVSTVVLITFLLEAAYSTFDFQGYPDLYPLLPYAALGLGGVAALVTARWASPLYHRTAATGVILAMVVLAALSCLWFTRDPLNDRGLIAQRADACAVTRMLGAKGTLYALGDPTALVLTGRRNPDRYIYLGGGVGAWKIHHTAGGFLAWKAQIRAAHPAVIAIRGWYGPTRRKMGVFLNATYIPAYVGVWKVFLSPEAEARARLLGVHLTHKAASYATGPSGHRLPTRC